MSLKRLGDAAMTIGSAPIFASLRTVPRSSAPSFWWAVGSFTEGGDFARTARSVRRASRSGIGRTKALLPLVRRAQRRDHCAQLGDGAEDGEDHGLRAPGSVKDCRYAIDPPYLARRA